MTPIALTIAGSDSGGGAGIQADLKTMSALNVFGASVITAVTAQNTREVTAVQGIDPDVVRAQISTVLTDLNVAAVKIGMLAVPPIIQAVADSLKDYEGPIVLDPVMIAKSGDALLVDDAIEALLRILVPKATILTPNLPEAARLLGADVARDEHEMIRQGQALCRLGAQAILMKGGHAEGTECLDVLVSGEAVLGRFVAPRLETQNTHGTGCTLSAAIASGLAKGHNLGTAVAQAHHYLQGAIAAADQLTIGTGHGPVHHFHGMWNV